MCVIQGCSNQGKATGWNPGGVGDICQAHYNEFSDDVVAPKKGPKQGRTFEIFDSFKND